MTSPAAPVFPPFRQPARAMALLHAGRIVAANPRLVEMCGYTRSELTSPEFQLSHIFSPSSPPFSTPGAAQGIRRDEATIDPLRGAPVRCVRTIWQLDDAAVPGLVMLLEPAGAPEAQPPGASEPHLLAAREVIRACSAHLADMLGRLRRAQLQIETLEHAHPEKLAHELRRVGGFIEKMQRLEEDVEALARSTGAR